MRRHLFWLVPARFRTKPKRGDEGVVCYKQKIGVGKAIVLFVKKLTRAQKCLFVQKCVFKPFLYNF